MEGCRHRLIPGSIPAIWKIEPRARETNETPQGKPCLILSKLQYCVSHEVFFFVEAFYVLVPDISAICKYIFK